MSLGIISRLESGKIVTVEIQFKPQMGDVCVCVYVCMDHVFNPSVGAEVLGPEAENGLNDIMCHRKPKDTSNSHTF